MINLEGFDLLGEIGGVAADVDDIANAQRRTRFKLHGHDREVAVLVGSAAVGCAGRGGGGLAASGCARWLTGLGLTATLAVGSPLLRAARRGGAFFAAFFLTILVFLTVFLRFALLVAVVFRRFALALVFVAMAASLTLTAFESLRPIVAE